MVVEQIQNIEEELNSGADALRDYNANEWKQDLMLQLNDSMTALKMANLGSSLLSPETVVPETLSSDTISVVDINDSIFQLDEALKLDLNWQENLPKS